MQLPARRLRAVYRRLFDAYGAQHWWPAASRFEVLVGAVLTQNTAWVNVERALANLAAAELLDAERLLACETGHLAGLLRPSGYFNVKSRRLQRLCAWFVAAGGFATLDTWPTGRLRDALLAVHGIGPESADDILLYAFDRPVFVIDAYTRRLLARLGLADGREAYDLLRHAFERALGADVPLYNEYHALLVRHARQHCRPRPCCTGCPLRRLCPSARA
jgi:endonuclease-3 related protein